MMRNSNSTQKIEQHHLLQTLSFSDHGSSWHCLRYVCSRVASVAQPPCAKRFQQKGGHTTNAAWKSKSGTFVLQLQQCTRAIGRQVVSKRSKTIPEMLVGLQLEKYVTGHGISNQRSEKQSSRYTADLDRFGHTWGAN